jgi:hypothetical protein
MTENPNESVLLIATFNAVANFFPCYYVVGNIFVEFVFKKKTRGDKQV